MKFPFLAQRMFNTPIMIHPDKAEVVMYAMMDRLGLSQVVNIAGDVHMAETFSQPKRTERGKYYPIVEGVAVIPVEGTLVNKLGSVEPYSGMTGYDGIRTMFLEAIDDPSVRGIVLDIESPGGEVNGCFDLADTIYSARGRKPIWSLLTEYAYSAGYALASAADKVIIPRTGGAGSIGVVWMHADWSQRIASEGIKVTFLHYGKYKVDGASELPLSEEAQARIQRDIDSIGGLFVSSVARNRGLSIKSVRDTEAATFQGQNAVDAGLADAVMAPDAAFMALLAEL